MLGVYQYRIFRLGLRDPRPRVFDSARVLRDGDDLEILVLQFAIKLLPAWQIKAAASPRSPGQQQDLLAAKIRERVQLAVAVGQLEVGRVQRGDVTILFISARPEKPRGMLRVISDRLAH
jgi:hypothetical protein